MNVLVYLVPMALGLGLIGLAAFLWSLRSGQYEDMDGAALACCLTTTSPMARDRGRMRVPAAQHVRHAP